MAFQRFTLEGIFSGFAVIIVFLRNYYPTKNWYISQTSQNTRKIKEKVAVSRVRNGKEKKKDIQPRKNTPLLPYKGPIEK